MSHVATVPTIISFAVFLLAGCGSQPTEPENAPSPGSGAQADERHAEHNGTNAGQTDMEKMNAELAKLSPEDRASAEKQHFCPVSGEMLGTMGAPIKMDVNGQQVWICCESCKEPLLSDPDQYLAKLPKE